MPDFETIALRLRDELLRQCKQVLSFRFLCSLLRSSWVRLCSIGVSAPDIVLCGLPRPYLIPCLLFTDGLGHSLPDTIYLLLVSESNNGPNHVVSRECKSLSLLGCFADLSDGSFDTISRTIYRYYGCTTFKS